MSADSWLLTECEVLTRHVDWECEARRWVSWCYSISAYQIDISGLCLSPGGE